MTKKSISSKKKRKFQENVFKEDEIKFYLNKVKKFAISEGLFEFMIVNNDLDDKSLIKNLQDSNKIKKVPKQRDSFEEESDSFDYVTHLDGSMDSKHPQFVFHENDYTSCKDDELSDTDDGLIEPKQVNEVTITSENFKTEVMDRLRMEYEEEESEGYKGDQTVEVQPDYRSVVVDRDFEVDLKRRKLPCCMMEQEIVDSVKNNDIVLITGDTGTGKSTQIPQFLYENGFCVKDSIIGVTQTRRVACIAISKQISMEMNSDKLIGYQIRYDKSYNDRSCKIKLMTDGILINELKNDILLSKYSVIIVDEAHERKVNSDILIGILSQVVKMRRKQFNFNQDSTIPLKLIIMSATIRKEDFLNSKLFEKVKHLHIYSNALNYTVHYNKNTPRNYLVEAKKKILQIHKLLPPGTILVFLTGKYELHELKKLLMNHSVRYRRNDDINSDKNENTNKDSGNCIDTTTTNNNKDVSNNTNLCENLDDNDEIFNLEGIEDEELSDTDDGLIEPKQRDYLEEKEDKRDDNVENDKDKEEDKEEYELKVLSENYKKSVDCEWLGSDGSGTLSTKILHASQTNKQQMGCFILPNEHERIVILSTNVAETSITLPNIRYVVDCGKEKRKVYNNLRGYENYEVFNISKSSADQRAGRCGRVGHGHCYRLYTNSVFENLFPDYSPVEILETNLCSAVLFLVSFGINPYYFTFLTRPPVEHITNSLRILCVLDAIRVNNNKGKAYKTQFSDILNDPFKIPATNNNNNNSISSLNNTNKDTSNCIDDSNTTNSNHNNKDNNDISITKLGRCLCLIPLEPRYSKMIYCILSKQGMFQDQEKMNNFISVSFGVVSILSFSGPVFIHQQDTDNSNSDNHENNKDVSNSIDDTTSNNKNNKDIRTKFKNDIELYVYIVCGYSRSEDKNSFCRENKINPRAMTEIFLQANQVCDIVKMNFKNLKFEIKLDKMNSLKVDELKLLSECIVECLVDKIAIGNRYLNQEDKSKGYKCQQMGNESVYLGNQYAKFKYECVCYNYLMGEDKIKMHNILSVNTAHLATIRSELIVSKEVERNPNPKYYNGSVVGYVKQYYKPLDYFLTITKVKLDDKHPLTYRVFAQAFCFGEIYEKLKEYSKYLVVDRDQFLKPIKTTSPIYNLLRTLFKKNMYNKNRFEEEYRKNRTFLLEEYKGTLTTQVNHEKLEDSFKTLL